MDLITLRTVLLITLSILLVIVLFIRFKRRTMQRDMPAISHAEGLHVEVAYHPVRLRVRLHVPGKQELKTTLLAADHAMLHAWTPEKRGPGTIELERSMPALPDGLYYIELATSTQRTVRQFRLQQV